MESEPNLINVRNSYPDMELTRISSKGQLVIPAEIRSEIDAKEGSIFAVSAFPEKNVIVLKKVSPDFTKEDLETVAEVEKAWTEIKEGKFRKYDEKEFFAMLKSGRL